MSCDNQLEISDDTTESILNKLSIPYSYDDAGNNRQMTTLIIGLLELLLELFIYSLNCCTTHTTSAVLILCV